MPVGVVSTRRRIFLFDSAQLKISRPASKRHYNPANITSKNWINTDKLKMEPRFGEILK